jgi:hypothetical protein
VTGEHLSLLHETVPGNADESEVFARTVERAVVRLTRLELHPRETVPRLRSRILDRVRERGRILRFQAASYRTRQLQVQGGPIISGMSSAELREPTGRNPDFALRCGAHLPRARPLADGAFGKRISGDRHLGRRKKIACASV